MLRGLADGVDFRMVGAYTVVVDDHAAVFVAMRRAWQGTVVTRCQYVFILYEHAAAMHSRAGSAFGCEHGELEEVFIPRRAFPIGGVYLDDFVGKHCLDSNSM